MMIKIQTLEGGWKDVLSQEGSTLIFFLKVSFPFNPNVYKFLGTFIVNVS